jgi:hypothetical protein
LREEVGKLH